MQGKMSKCPKLTPTRGAQRAVDNAASAFEATTIEQRWFLYRRKSVSPVPQWCLHSHVAVCHAEMLQ